MRTPGKKPIQSAALLFVLLWFGCTGVQRPDPADTDPPAALRSHTAFSYTGEGSWYRGDLHCHTTHSDGDSGVAAVIASAEAAGLDFLAVTDHDTSMVGNPSHWYDPDFRSERLILLYGVEWTSAKGHGNIFASSPFDYTALWKANRECDAEGAVTAAHREGALFSINHPKGLIGAWKYDGLCGADFIEIWNAPFYLPGKNRLAVEHFWQEALLQGLHVPGIGGSDNHQLKGYQRNINSHGYPVTWVFAKEPTPEGILEGIKKGRVTISAAPETGRLELTADTDGDGVFEAMMGDTVKAGQAVTLKLGLLHPRREKPYRPWETYDIILYKNGKRFMESALRPARKPWIIVTDMPEGPGFYRAELYGRTEAAPVPSALMGETLAVTNPIYMGNR